MGWHAWLGILANILIALALPPALIHRSWLRFFIAVILSFVGILVPLFVFVASAFMSPDAKSQATHGWVDCFYLGKLALAPVVLWASAALYALEVYKVRQQTRPWIVLGFFLGAIVSAVCFAFGVFTVILSKYENAWLAFWLFVPFYTSIWYVLRSVLLIRSSRLKPRDYLIAFSGSVPFWVWSILWSRSQYRSLPPSPHSCFVVTAASRGHRRLVGEAAFVRRAGKLRIATRQLVTFWRFETLWRLYAPWSHRFFRRYYNSVGPSVAAWVSSAWIADLVFVALKPLEIAASLALALAGKRQRPGLWLPTGGEMLQRSLTPHFGEA